MFRFSNLHTEPIGGGEAGFKKLGFQDTRQFAFSYTNEAGLEAQRLDRTQLNVYLLQTARQSLPKATATRQYYT